MALVVAAGVVAAQLAISRSTVDGGGVMRNTGGSFELCGTIGQPNAGVLVNGNRSRQWTFHVCHDRQVVEKEPKWLLGPRARED